MLTDEGGFKERLAFSLGLLAFEEFGNCLFDILHLSIGIFLKLLRIKVRTSTELQDLFTERVADGVVDLEVRLVDNIIQGSPCKVTQQDRLRIGLRLEAS